MKWGIRPLYSAIQDLMRSLIFQSEPKYKLWVVGFQGVSELSRVYFWSFPINSTLIELWKRSKSDVSMTQTRIMSFRFQVVSKVPQGVLCFEISVTSLFWSKISIPDRENVYTRAFSDSDFRVRSSFFLKSSLCSSDSRKNESRTWPRATRIEFATK